MLAIDIVIKIKEVGMADRLVIQVALSPDWNRASCCLVLSSLLIDPSDISNSQFATLALHHPAPTRSENRQPSYESRR
jgi:hypothetical protein